MASLYRIARRIKNTVPGLDWCYQHLKLLRVRPPDYRTRMATEEKFYRDLVDIADLPRICHYWAPKYIRPLTLEYGISQPDDLFAIHFAESAKRCAAAAPEFISIGAGNCGTEVAVARMLKDSGLERFTIECQDMNAHTLARGRALAEREGVADHLRFVECDFNEWRASKRYTAIMANQSLHHVLKLEHLFDEIQRALDPRGYFVAYDIIGRNGHQRWPEALQEVQRFWKELPDSYRYNLQLDRHEAAYKNWDSSHYSFEGIRAQDILPLLIERFDFRLFIAFSNVIDPFVDRSFGHHFDPDREWDRDFIDRVQAFDEDAIRSGRLTPTHMMAVMTPGPSDIHEYSRGISPQAAVRRPEDRRKAKLSDIGGKRTGS
jgi:SAM-dependent methyltransferase